MKKSAAKISAEDSLVTAQRHLAAVLRDVNWPQFADRIRLARLRQGFSIRELAAKAEVSKTSVVRLESGKACETETVARICHAMGLHADALIKEFSANNRVAIHKKNHDAWYDLVRFSDGLLVRKDGSPLTPSERKKRSLNAGVVPLNIFASRLPGGKLLSTAMELFRLSPTRSHPGEEWVYVLHGIAVITVADNQYELGPGESIVFRSAEPHSYAPKNDKDLPVRIISVRLDG